jgi:hypothetical protein
MDDGSVFEREAAAGQDRRYAISCAAISFNFAVTG